jgi:hypothetical protein
MIPSGLPWFRVFSAQGHRLVLQALDSHDACRKANHQWTRMGVDSRAHEAREARPDEVTDHKASVRGLERIG